ncbi:uncharacterized protein F5Z01DRAFT_629056 [Emericellopsis atlantica]|uniref:DUF676 domain-containing protein n=1 Tax=Emericellopsis atlantica TaxID=2614577 RepID=A0A9P8CKK5_9HYPO|nr:uncharacterized protein F5Z01DRAFT_629056 [Emericellopsis atlantica]KAG9250664.1 hypothetical protein F5Z01DRAFT_629056 [Emericellopsis atlantica]
MGNDKALQLTLETFQGASDLAVNMFLNAAAKRTLQAWRPYLGFAPGIWEAILSNPINKKTLDFVFRRKAELADFIIDLIEPVKRFVRSDSDERTTVCDLNAFNELDLTKPMNRHASMCQIQRLLKSIVSILHGRDQDKSLADFVMDTRLDSDCDDAITDVIQDSIGTNTPETWFFINGIAGESQWLKLALDKLKARFGQGDKDLGTITGIFNRGDGILWDLIECAGQRCAENGTDTDNVIQRTKSSQKAESLLKDELLKALTKERAKPENEQDPVIVIAHSQGCLLLRLVLEELASDPRDLAIMQKSLMVFTFGNPSVDWEIHKSCNHTEHYANEKDFVAWLGVLRQDDDDSSGRFHYENLINKGKKGHLFGAHYDLEEGAYECVSHKGERSRLFTGK